MYYKDWEGRTKSRSREPQSHQNIDIISKLKFFLAVVVVVVVVISISVSHSHRNNNLTETRMRFHHTTPYHRPHPTAPKRKKQELIEWMNEWMKKKNVDVSRASPSTIGMHLPDRVGCPAGGLSHVRPTCIDGMAGWEGPSDESKMTPRTPVGIRKPSLDFNFFLGSHQQ